MQHFNWLTDPQQNLSPDSQSAKFLLFIFCSCISSSKLNFCTVCRTVHSTNSFLHKESCSSFYKIPADSPNSLFNVFKQASIKYQYCYNYRCSVDGYHITGVILTMNCKQTLLNLCYQWSIVKFNVNMSKCYEYLRQTNSKNTTHCRSVSGGTQRTAICIPQSGNIVLILRHGHTASMWFHDDSVLFVQLILAWAFLIAQKIFQG